MKPVYIALFVVPACTGFFAQIRDRVVDHFEQKLKRPECHVEWEDVTTPHCETHHEQVCVEEYKNQCKTEYEELCETTDHQKCHTELDQQCHEEFNEECKTEYSEQCWDEPREACHKESSQECSTEYSEVCGTEYEQACHTEYAEECWDEPECWVEEKEECHNVQVEVHHHDHQPKHQYKKWKRSVDGVVSEVEDMGDEVKDIGEDESEEDAELSGGEEVVESEAVAEDGTVRKERSLGAVALGALGAAHLAGAVVGGHIGKKLGFGTGLAIGLGAKKHASKEKANSAHVHSKAAPVHIKAYASPKVVHHAKQKQQ